MLNFSWRTGSCTAAAVFSHCYGAVSTQAARAGCSRHTVYDHARVLAQRRLHHREHRQQLRAANAALRPQLARAHAHRATATPPLAQRLPRLAVTAQALGISLRQVEELLATPLPADQVPDHAPWGRWARAAAGQASQVLARRAPLRQPLVQTLCVEEIFWGGATPVAVEPTGPALRACARTDDRAAAARQEVLPPFAAPEFVAAAAAQGLAAGVQAVAATRAERTAPVPPAQGLDVGHTARAARRVPAGPWRRAAAAWGTAEAAEQGGAADKRPGRASRGAAPRARGRRAGKALAGVDRHETARQQVRAALAVFTAAGRLHERARAQRRSHAALADRSGPPWQKVRNSLRARRRRAFLGRRHRRPAAAVPAAAQGTGWVRRWWRRHHGPAAAGAATTVAAQAGRLVDEVIRQRAAGAADQGAQAKVAAVVRTAVRASSAAEGLTSVLRRPPCRQRRMTQGLWDRKRLYGNGRRLPTGKRRKHCPYE